MALPVDLVVDGQDGAICELRRAWITQIIVGRRLLVHFQKRITINTASSGTTFRGNFHPPPVGHQNSIVMQAHQMRWVAPQLGGFGD